MAFYRFYQAEEFEKYVLYRENENSGLFAC